MRLAAGLRNWYLNQLRKRQPDWGHVYALADGQVHGEEAARCSPGIASRMPLQPYLLTVGQGNVGQDSRANMGTAT